MCIYVRIWKMNQFVNWTLFGQLLKCAINTETTWREKQVRYDWTAQATLDVAIVVDGQQGVRQNVAGRISKTDGHSSAVCMRSAGNFPAFCSLRHSNKINKRLKSPPFHSYNSVKRVHAVIWLTVWILFTSLCAYNLYMTVMQITNSYSSVDVSKVSIWGCWRPVEFLLTANEQ